MERTELKAYLLDSIQTKNAMISHRVITYQGVYAVIIYQPLFDENHQFKGWLNVLIDIDVWLKDQLKIQGWDSVYIKMHWENPDSHDLVLGEKKPEKTFSYEFQVLNQMIRIQVGLLESALGHLQKNLLFALDILGLMMISLISFLIIQLTRSRYNLVKANHQLGLKNILLNSLAHDLSTPLTSLGLNIQMGSFKNDITTLSPEQRTRILKSLSTLHEMLESVRCLSLLEMQSETLKTQSVSVLEALNESRSRVIDKALDKKVSIEIKPTAENLMIKADKQTLVNNVLPNILMNAIKFSPPHSQISVETQVEGAFVSILVKDQGKGFSNKDMESFNFNGQNLKSSSGSLGELGTGLGLAQVKGFMKLYGGKATIESSKLGASVKLSFFAAQNSN